MVGANCPFNKLDDAIETGMEISFKVKRVLRVISRPIKQSLVRITLIYFSSLEFR